MQPIESSAHVTRRSALFLRGFTLIELMVVIGIIGVLISIALPAFSKMRREAKRTSTAATIGTIELGVNAFRADSQLGGNYPISYRVVSCMNPHDRGGSGKIDGNNGLNGAELLAWALSGADQLGTPGFRNVDGITLDPESHDDSIYGGWTSDSGRNNTTPANLYALDTSNQPAYHRTQFVDLSKMKMPKPVVNGNITQYEYDFRSKPTRATYSFLDSFGQPILYYRANRTAPQFVGYTPDKDDYPDLADTQKKRGVYELMDNRDFTGRQEVSDDKFGMDFGGGSEHPLSHMPDMGSWPADVTLPVSPKGSFPAVLQNTTITAKRQPHNPDSFILISAGPDGLYGTGDDVANFPLNQ